MFKETSYKFETFFVAHANLQQDLNFNKASYNLDCPSRLLLAILIIDKNLLILPILITCYLLTLIYFLIYSFLPYRYC